MKPIIHEDGITYCYVQYNNVYMLALSRTNTNAMSTLYFLHRLVDVFKFYFQVRFQPESRYAHASQYSDVYPAELSPRSAVAGEPRPCPMCVGGDTFPEWLRFDTIRRMHLRCLPRDRFVLWEIRGARAFGEEGFSGRSLREP